MSEYIEQAQKLISDGNIDQATQMLVENISGKTGIALVQYNMMLSNIFIYKNQLDTAKMYSYNAASALINEGLLFDAVSWLSSQISNFSEYIDIRLLYRYSLMELANSIADIDQDHADELRKIASDLEVEKNFCLTASPDDIHRWWEKQSQGGDNSAIVREVCAALQVAGHDRGLLLFRLVADVLPEDLAPALLDKVAAMAVLAQEPDLALHRHVVELRMTKFVGQRLATIQPLVPPTGPQSLPDRPRIGFLDITYLYLIPHYRGTLLNESFRVLAANNFDVFVYIRKMDPSFLEQDLTGIVPDGVTLRYLSCYSQDAADVIFQDNLDALLLLNGYVQNAPLDLFAYRPAKRLAQWVHTYGTYGPNLFDAIVVDEHSYNDLHAAMSFEQPVGRVGYPVLLGAPLDAPDVQPPPCLKNGYITFGVVARLEKLGPACFALWRDVLARLPNARLRLHSIATARSEDLRAKLAEMAAHGVPMARVDLAEEASLHRDHLAALCEIDIVLDAFPFTGGLTTFEALWQGVPVVGRFGDLTLSRTSLIYLSESGVPQWLGRSAEECADIAVALAGDVQALERWRFGLRDHMRRSRFMDPDCFVERFRAAMTELLALPARGWTGA